MRVLIAVVAVASLPFTVTAQDTPAPDWIMLTMVSEYVDGEWEDRTLEVLVRRADIEHVSMLVDGELVGMTVVEIAGRAPIGLNTSMEAMCAALRCEQVPTRLQQAARGELRSRSER